MARKVFISVLGTGLYESCKYAANGFCSSETRFVQQATLEYLKAHEWPQDSGAYILLTDKARTSNWVVEGNMRNDKQKVISPYYGLKDILDSATFLFPIEEVPIPDGKDETEMWQIFETVFKLLQEGDELYFDLTHSFRYLPMLMLVLGNYAKFLKKVSVCSITYGNYEARNKATNEAPIVNLLSLSSLQDWTFATADYLKNGYADKLVELSKKGLDPLMRESEEIRKDEDAKHLRSFVNNLKNFSLDMQTCRGLNIIDTSSIKRIKTDIDSLNKVVIPQLEPVLHKVRESLKPFDDAGNVMNAIKAAQWCFDNQQYQQSTTFLEEGVISYFCQRHGIALDAREKRELVTSAFNIVGQNKPKEEWKVKKDEWKDLLGEIVNDELMKNKQLTKTFNSLAVLRNDYNHCGMRDNKKDSDKIRKGIKSCLDTITPLLIDNIEYCENKENCLINLSNHPSQHWNKEQVEAAANYGEIKDIPFPTITPDFCEDDIRKLADVYIKKILELEKLYHITVHVMGEMTFTYQVVSQLKAMGIDCIASTTDRNSVELTDGRKITDFQFVKFRSY